MRKIFIYMSTIFLLTIITAGATYAYLVSITNSNVNTVIGEGAEINVLYTGGKAIEGLISMTEDKSGGLNTTVNISLDASSVVVKSNLYININQITSALATEGFVWEVYKTVNGVESFVNSGTFLDCESGDTTKKCAAGDRLYIVNDYVLSTTNTAFTVYVWLDGNKVGNEVMGATFSGTIAAESEKFTGKLD